jgi:tetratricopeptide (TPR) repeat protein
VIKTRFIIVLLFLFPWKNIHADSSQECHGFWSWYDTKIIRTPHDNRTPTGLAILLFACKNVNDFSGEELHQIVQFGNGELKVVLTITFHISIDTVVSYTDNMPVLEICHAYPPGNYSDDGRPCEVFHYSFQKTKYVAQEKENPYVVYQYKLFADTNKVEKAINELLEKSHAYDINDSIVFWHKTAMELFRANNKKEAAAFFADKIRDRHADVINTHTTIINNYGFLLEQSGQYDKAVYILSAVISAFPSRTVAYLNLADAYAGLGDTVKAKTNYSKYADMMKTAGKQSKIPKRVLQYIDR